jgi:hypothetical protein
MEAKRPWWRKKRFWAACMAAWLIVYPFGAAPAMYAVGRWPATRPMMIVLYFPLAWIKIPAGHPVARALMWCQETGRDHRENPPLRWSSEDSSG